MKKRNDSIVYPRFIITQTADNVNSRREQFQQVFSPKSIDMAKVMCYNGKTMESDGF